MCSRWQCRARAPGSTCWGNGPPHNKHARAPFDPGRTQACNLWFRGPTPYSLGHRTTCDTHTSGRFMSHIKYCTHRAGPSLAPRASAEAKPVVSATTAVRACANEGSTVADFSSRLCSAAQRASACAELGHNVQCARDRQADELPRALILAGLEPAIFGSEDQRLIH